MYAPFFHSLNLAGLLIFLLPLLALSLLRPKAGLLALVFILPFHQIHTTAAGLDTNFLELSALAVVAGAMLNWQFTKKQKRALAAAKKIANILPMIFVFLAAVLLALIFSPSPETAWPGFRHMFLLPVIIFIIGLLAFNKPADGQDLITALVCSAGAVSVFGLLEYFRNFSQLPDGRLDSVFDSANYHAMFVAPMAVLGLGYILASLKGQANWRLLAVGPATAANLLSVYYSFSLSAFMGMLAGLAVLLAFALKGLAQKRKLQYRLAIASAALAAVLFVSLNHDSAVPNVAANLDLEARQTSITGREQIWFVSREMLADNYLSGVGLSGYGFYYVDYAEKYFAADKYEINVFHPHNIFLMFWLETGLAGLTAFVCLIVYAVYLAFRVKNSYAFKWLALAALATALGHGLTDTTYFKPDLAVQFWLLLALLYFHNGIFSYHTHRTFNSAVA